MIDGVPKNLKGTIFPFRYNNFDVMRTTLKRRDKTSIVDLSLNYKLNSSISIGINGNYMDNNSNLATSTYINKKASLTLTYLF